MPTPQHAAMTFHRILSNAVLWSRRVTSEFQHHACYQRLSQPSALDQVDFWSAPHRQRVLFHLRVIIPVAMDMVIGFFARNGNSGEGDGPRAATLPCLTYKIPRYADRQPYNGKVMEAGLLICN